MLSFITNHKVFLVLVLALTLILFPAGVALAQEVLPGEPVAGEVAGIPTAIPEFVGWLALNGLTIVAILNKFSAYQKLDTQAKGVIAFVITVGAPFLSEGLQYVLTIADPAIVAQVQHYLDLGLKGFNLYAGSQFAYLFYKKLAG